MLAFKLILRRLLQQLGPGVLWPVAGIILLIIALNLLMFAIVFVECLVLEPTEYWIRGPGWRKFVCR